MNKPRIFVCAAALLSGMALIAARAQTTPPGANQASHQGQRGLQKLRTLAQELNLSEDQKAQIKPILKDAAQQIRSVRQDASLTPEQRKAKIKAIRQDSRKQIIALLTPEQKKQLRQIAKERREQKKGTPPAPDSETAPI